MKITWQTKDLPTTGSMVGHGLCLMGPEGEDRERRLVGFVEGFGWLHDGADTVVWFDPQRFPAAGPLHDAIRAGIEAVVRNREHPSHADLAPGYTYHTNA